MSVLDVSNRFSNGRFVKNMSLLHDRCIIMLLCIENNAVIEVDKLRDAMKVCRNTEGIFFHFL